MPSNFPYSGYGPPTYTEKEIQALRVKQVHFLSEHMLFLLSDDKILCAPVSANADLVEASEQDRRQWQLIGEGRAVVWDTPGLAAHVSLRALLEHPEAKVGELAGGPSLFPPPGSR